MNDRKGFRGILAGFLFGCIAAGILALLLFPTEQATEPVRVVEVPGRRAPELRVAGTSAQATAPDKEPGQLIVEICDEAAHPLQGARLHLVADDERVLLDDARAYQQSSPASGRFAIASTDGQAPQDEAPRRFLAWAAGYVPMAFTWTEVASLAVEGVAVVKLSPGAVVSGRTVDSMGVPVAGVTVRALGRHGMDILLDGERVPGLNAACDHQVAVSDDQGRFRLSGVGGFPIRLRAEKVHFLHAYMGPMPAVEQARNDIKLTLHPLARIGMKFVDVADGKPISAHSLRWAFPAGTTLGAYEDNTRPALLPADGANAETGERWHTLKVVNSDFRELGENPTVRAVVGSPGYRDKEIEVEVRGPDHAGYALAQKFELEREPGSGPLVDVSVRVECAALGAKLSTVDVLVRAIPEDRSQRPSLHPASLQLDDQGRAQFRLPEGEYLIAPMRSSVWIWWEPATRSGAKATIRASEKNEVVIRLPGALVDCELKRKSGEPLIDFIFTLAKKTSADSPELNVMGSLTASTIMHGEVLAPYRRSLTSGPGHFQMFLAPGAYTGILLVEGHKPQLHPFTVSDGQTLKLSLRPGKANVEK